MNEEINAEENEIMLLMLEELAHSKLATRDEAVAFRAASGVERRWLDDEKMFDGRDTTDSRSSMMDSATGKLVTRKNNRSEVWVNIVRGKTETAVGRFTEIMLPVDGKNYGLKTTPLPELSGVLEDRRPAHQESGPVLREDGTQASMADVAVEVQEEAEKKMAGMETQISDQLTECRYNSLQRKAIFSAAKYGTGVLKGPVVIKDIKKSWQSQEVEGESLQVLKMVESLTPSSKFVPVWNCYPAPECDEDTTRMPYMWEKDTILPREVRMLIGVPGYKEDQLQKVLEEEPIRTVATVEKDSTWIIARDAVNKGLMYEMWEYNGDIDVKEMELFGCECDSNNSTVAACLVFINDRLVKAVLNPIDTGEIPYDFFQWTEVSGSAFGIGIPRQMAWMQLILNGAWRAMMDNAGDSSGVNVVIGGNVEPVDGKWELTGKKLWRLINKDDDVRQAFAQFQVANNQADLQNIIDLVMRFVDLETSTPTIFQGEAKEAPDTLGATNIVVNSANITFRQRIKLYDDKITTPHIARYYDYNMQHGKDEEIKGDYKVDPLGVSVLYEKDQMGQVVAQIFGLHENPVIERRVDWDKATDKYFKSRNVDDILKSPQQLIAYDEKKKSQPVQQNPALEVAKIKTEGDLQKAKLNQNSDMAELELKQKMAEDDRKHEIAIKNLEINMLMLKLANEKGISLDSIKAALASDSMKLQTQKELSLATGKAKQVSTPVTEPVGRAPSGEAYQR